MVKSKIQAFIEGKKKIVCVIMSAKIITVS